MSRIRKILESPLGRTVGFAGAVLLSGVMCSAFVTEITVDGKLAWDICYRKPTFWLLILMIAVYLLYSIFIYRNEKYREDFADDQFCREYLRSTCLPEFANKLKELIRRGNSSAELIEVHAFYEKLHKEQKP